MKDKYKVKRKVAECHRKERKKAKRNSKLGIIDHSKKKKDPGIPNSWPFKKELLNEVERVRELASQEKERLRKPKNLEELLARSQNKVNEFNEKEKQVAVKETPRVGNEVSLGQNSRRAYLRELKKVIEASDVILEILDCRDPVSTRISKAVEDTILSHFEKRLVLVLNKIDLVPKDAVKGWLNHLRNFHPTIAIRAGIAQNSSSVVGHAKGEKALESTNAIGIDALLQLLKNYARISPSESTKTCITVGIIGYPNVGKSSILNSLKRIRAVGVSPTPGFTKSMQEIKLDKNIRLVDSPGVVFDDEASSGTHIVLRNCIKVDSVQDPIPAIQSLLAHTNTDSLIMTYGIAKFPEGDHNMFLAMIAKKFGKVLKGGIPDKISAAKTILRDWNTGKIPYFTPPPQSTRTTLHEDACIVQQFGPEQDVKLLNMLEIENKHDSFDFVQLNLNNKSKQDNGKQLVNMLISDGLQENNSAKDGNDTMDVVHTSQGESSFDNSRMAEAEDFDFTALK